MFTRSDHNGCLSSTVVTLTEPDALVASNTHGSISCHGGTTTVSVSAVGGTTPYDGTGTFSQGQGTTTYTVTDHNGCLSSTVVTLTEPDALVASNTHGSISCHGGTTTVSVSAVGGTTPYDGTGTFSQGQGTTTYTVTDHNGCMSSTVVTLTEPDALVATSSNTPILCNGGSSTVTVNASGGTGPYQGTGTFTRSAGTYSYTVTDANSCTATTTGNITQPSALTLSLQAGACSSGSNGSIVATFGSGTGPYQVKIDAGNYFSATS